MLKSTLCHRHYIDWYENSKSTLFHFVELGRGLNLPFLPSHKTIMRSTPFRNRTKQKSDTRVTHQYFSTDQYRVLIYTLGISRLESVDFSSEILLSRSGSIIGLSKSVTLEACCFYTDKYRTEMVVTFQTTILSNTLGCLNSHITRYTYPFWGIWITMAKRFVF